MADIPDFTQYAEDAQGYLNRPIFKGTPLTGDALAQQAWAGWANTGTQVPVDLALAQLQRETFMGTKGRAGRATNPANVGEFDRSTTKTYPSLNAGLAAYYNLLATKYLKNKSVAELLQNFVNTEGKRYATDKGYEKYFSTQVPYIQRYITRSRQNALQK